MLLTYACRRFAVTSRADLLLVAPPQHAAAVRKLYGRLLESELEAALDAQLDDFNDLVRA